MRLITLRTAPFGFSMMLVLDTQRINAGVVARLNGYARFRSFGHFAGAAAVGLLAVTVAAIAQPVFDLHPALLAGAVAVFAAERFGASPVLLLVLAAGVGAAVGAVAG